MGRKAGEKRGAARKRKMNHDLGAAETSSNENIKLNAYLYSDL